MRLLHIALLTLVFANAFSQGNVDTFYQLKKTEYTSAELIRELVTSCNVNIYYSSGEIDSGKTKFFKSGKVKDIIDQLAKVNNADFKLVNNQFVLKRKKQASTKTPIELKTSAIISPGTNNNQVSVARSNESHFKRLLPIFVEPFKTQKDMKLKNSSLEKFRKKTLATLAAAMLLSNTNTFSQFDIGITAGGNFSTLDKVREGSITAKPGFQAGITMITPLNKTVHLRNDILFTRQILNLKFKTGYTTWDSINPSEFHEYNVTEDLFVSSIKIPFSINYVFQTEQINFYFGFGVYYEYLLSGSAKIKWGGKSIDPDVSFRKGDYSWQGQPFTEEECIRSVSMLVLNRNQLGLVANMGISRKEWIFNLSYEPSLIQYPIEGWGNMRQWKFGVTYLLDFRKKKE